jgi:hypothetical protein
MNPVWFALLVLSMALGALHLPGLLGEIAVYPWLGFFPGLALTAWLLPREERFTRIALALAVSPLLTSGFGWMLVRAGLAFPAAAVLLAMVGWLGCAIALLAGRLDDPEERDPLPLPAMAWAIGLGLVLLAVPVINPYIFIRGDSWLHAGFVMELMERGFPPQDTRMAGVPLNYVWFFNLYIALLGGLQNQNIFHFMTLLNACDGFVTVALTAWIAHRVWRSARATHATAALLVVGLNAGAWLLWPLNLIRVWIGRVQGNAEWGRLAGSIEIGKARVIYSLSAPGSDMVSFLDKLLVGTALNIAYVYMVLFLWALVRWCGDRRRDALLWLALGASGMMFFHSVVGLSVLPVTAGVLGLAWLARGRWTWLPTRGTLVAAAAATLAGALVTWPYMRSITAGWAPEKAGFHHRYVQFRADMIWTLATACCFAVWFARRPLAEGWRRRDPLVVLLGGLTLAMAVFACSVYLPMHNSVKFVFEFFTTCAILAAPAFADWVARSYRARPAVFATLLMAVFGLPTLLTLHGYLVDPTGETRAEIHPRPGEEALYGWLRDETPIDAVLVDRDFRDLMMVKARRRLYLGTEQPADLAAFPVAEMQRRHRAMLDLYGPMAHPDSVVEGLRSLGKPTYVIYRPEDSTAIVAPWDRLVAAAPGSVLIYKLNHYHVVKLSPRGAS